jgi:CubicO group peptidase (beta-lactamase class C family)
MTLRPAIAFLLAILGAAVRAVLSRPLAYQPGHGYRYGDDDYELLAALIETVSRQPWDRFVQLQILDPVGLKETGFWCGAHAVPPPAPRVDGTLSRCSRQDRGTSLDDWGHRGANGMSSTVEDLLRWVRALDSGPGIPETIRHLMTEPRVLARHEAGLDVDAGYGLRIYLRNGRVIERWHSGSGDDGHTAVVRVMADGTIIMVLTNTGWRGETPWASDIATRLSLRR